MHLSRLVLLCVALVMNFCTLRKKALTSLLTTTTQAIASCFSRHACTEAVLTFTNSLRWLVRAFSHNMILSKSICIPLLEEKQGAGKLVISTAMSMRHFKFLSFQTFQTSRRQTLALRSSLFAALCPQKRPLTAHSLDERIQDLILVWLF